MSKGSMVATTLAIDTQAKPSTIRQRIDPRRSNNQLKSFPACTAALRDSSHGSDNVLKNF
jgi:hypothetical protein